MADYTPFAVSPASRRGSVSLSPEIRRDQVGNIRRGVLPGDGAKKSHAVA
ncbi:MAG: hypothetical protein MZV64_00145 [Ignavibacteriales bacterium]|nr:hypothetical protein [Ignavibacteriales bacterium]